MPFYSKTLPVFMAVTTVASGVLRAEAPPTDYLKEQPVRAQHAMVVSVHHLAADAGIDIIREGGNAVDAAGGDGVCAAVVHPAAGNLGGGAS